MDINRAIKEYESFYNDYNTGEMFRLRQTMKQLSLKISTYLLNNNDKMTVKETNDFNTKMNEINDQYNNMNETYMKLIDTYFPYTKEYIPKMMPLLYDDKFNYFNVDVYRDVLFTYNNLVTGKTNIDSTMKKVHSIVKKSVKKSDN